MATRTDTPLSGVFRVVYFLTTGAACLFVVVTAITAFYSPPEGDSGFPGNASLFGPGVSIDQTPTQRVSLDTFLDAVINGDVDYVEVDGTKLTYTLYSGFTRYETELEAGADARETILDAGVEPDQLPFIEVRQSSDGSGNNDREDYNRNVSLIFVVAAAGAFAVAIHGLGARFNPLRAGLMLGGLLLFLTGMGLWADSTSEWLGFVSSAAILLLLAAGFPSLDDGLPLRAGAANAPRRLTPEEMTIPREDEQPAGDEQPPAPFS